MFLIDVLQIFLLWLLVLEERVRVFLPHLRLLLVDLLLVNLLLPLLLYLPCQVLPHTLLLLLLHSLSALLLLLLLLQLVFNVTHHLLILYTDLLLLIFDDWVCEGGHDCFDLILPLLLLLLSLFLELVLQSGILLLSLYILNIAKNTSMRSRSASSLARRWFYSFSTMTCWKRFSSFSLRYLASRSYRVSSYLIFWTRRWSSSSSFFF